MFTWYAIFLESCFFAGYDSNFSVANLEGVVQPVRYIGLNSTLDRHLMAWSLTYICTKE